MTRFTQQATKAADSRSDGNREAGAEQPQRIRSEDLFRQQREVEIDHQGRIYRLRLTQLNKLILTA